MANGLDMSLEDLIKTNKTSVPRGGFNFRGRGGGGGGGGGGWSGPGPARRFPNRLANRPAPYALPKASEPIWSHDFIVDQAALAAAVSLIDTGTKLYISNLDYGVSNEDIRELFLEVGELKKYSVHYDKSGRSKGTAEIVFARRMDALAAVKRYNNVQLDGKPMKIEVVGTNVAPAPLLPTPVFASFANPMSSLRMGHRRGGLMGRGDGGRGFGRGRVRGRSRGEKVSAEELDAELDKYHSEAMQTN